jgi:hypothetical protein
MSGPRRQRVHRVHAPVLGGEPGSRTAVDLAGGTVVRRQMVLGPAPECAVLAREEPELPWPARPRGPHAV